jgi:probable F420-dependent oxidoreductase
MDTIERLGRVGVWSGRLQRQPTVQAIAAVNEYSDLGYGAVWIPESPGAKDVLTFATVLLGASSDVVIATGIAIMWVRDPVAMMNASRTLADAFPGRFLLGLGVSHRSTAEMRGHDYERPLSQMRAYLEAMDEAPFDGYPPEHPAPRVLAALGPRMVALAGELTEGIHPFLSTPDHVFRSRQTLGPGKVICVEQAVVDAPDPDDARSLARENLSRYLAWPNYRRHLDRLGFTDDDLEGVGSDRLLDALYVFGDAAAVRSRVEDHLSAGADHVCLQVVAREDSAERTVLREIAPAVLGL